MTYSLKTLIVSSIEKGILGKADRRVLRMYGIEQELMSRLGLNFYKFEAWKFKMIEHVLRKGDEEYVKTGVNF